MHCYNKARQFIRQSNLTPATTVTLPLHQGVLKTPGNCLQEEGELGAPIPHLQEKQKFI